MFGRIACYFGRHKWRSSGPWTDDLSQDLCVGGRICERCSKTEKISKPHFWDWKFERPTSCVQYLECWRCATWDHSMLRMEHDFVVQATRSNEFIEISKCSRCGEEKTRLLRSVEYNVDPPRRFSAGWTGTEGCDSSYDKSQSPRN